MKTLRGTTSFILFSTILLCITISLQAQEYPTLEIGQAAPDFHFTGD